MIRRRRGHELPEGVVVFAQGSWKGTEASGYDIRDCWCVALDDTTVFNLVNTVFTKRFDEFINVAC